MIPGDAGDRRADWKSRLVERLHDPLQLRIFVIGVVLAAGYMFVYTPLAAHIAATHRGLERERKLSQLAETIEQLQGQCKEFTKRMPKQADGKEWMQYVMDGVRGLPVKLAKIDYLAPKKLGPYQVAVLKIELAGSYYELDQFLRWVESNPRLLRTDEITISLAKEKAENKPKPKGRGKAEEELPNLDDMVMRVTVLGLAG